MSVYLCGVCTVWFNSPKTFDDHLNQHSMNISDFLGESR